MIAYTMVTAHWIIKLTDRLPKSMPMHDTSSEVHGSTITVHNSTNSYTQHDVQRLRLVRYWRERLTSRV